MRTVAGDLLIARSPRARPSIMEVATNFFLSQSRMAMLRMRLRMDAKAEAAVQAFKNIGAKANRSRPPAPAGARSPCEWEPLTVITTGGTRATC